MRWCDYGEEQDTHATRFRVFATRSLLRYVPLGTRKERERQEREKQERKKKRGTGKRGREEKIRCIAR